MPRNRSMRFFMMYVVTFSYLLGLQSLGEKGKSGTTPLPAKGLRPLEPC